MSLSPRPESPNNTKIKESPSRYRNRFTDRFQSISNLSSSPSRDTTTASQPSFVSPIHPMDTKKVIENEKYSAFEIKNEDRGQWRESEKNDDEQMMEQHDSPTPIQPENQKQQIEQDGKASAVTLGRRVPRYMQATRSFYEKVSTKKESSLGPRSKGGIAKKVGTSKIPRYRSTTQINAVEEIKNEMTAEDVYVSMAARIKLFEKGLGNNGASSQPSLQRQKSTSSTNSTENSSVNKSMTPTRSAKLPSTHSSVHHTPNYLRQTSASATKQREIRLAQRQREIDHHHETHPQSSTTVTRTKPFRFATSERAKHFKEKLKLWQVKDQQANVSRKRKNSNGHHDISNQKHQRTK
ncbi:MAG: hypothetical protein EXX96DRAFT_610995 [Benjaminiella poitrasii]|nr:MAG: hypothetical protein EXX96DRAFT_610995 [Benjaminiella poitrasii]